MSTQPTNTPAIPAALFTSDELRAITSFRDAWDAVVAKRRAEPAMASTVLGDGFALLEDKNALVGIPLLFLTWEFRTGDYGEYVSAHVITQGRDGNAGKFILNDGSTGVYAQLRNLTDQSGINGGLAVERGLRRSDYRLPNGDPATTFYIDSSAKS